MPKPLSFSIPAGKVADKMCGNNLISIRARPRSRASEWRWALYLCTIDGSGAGVKSERGQNYGHCQNPQQFSFPITCNLSCHTQLAALHMSRAISSVLGSPVVIHHQKLTRGLESGLLRTTNPLRSSLFHLICKNCEYSFMYILVNTHLPISTNIASFRTIRSCLPSSRPSMLLILPSSEY